MNKQAYYLNKMTHNELVERMESATLEKTGVPLKYVYELALDGNSDLYIKDYSFTKKEVDQLVEAKWFDESVLEDFEQHGEIIPFESDDELSQPHNLFNFLLNQTFGRAHVAGVEEMEGSVLLNIATDAN